MNRLLIEGLAHQGLGRPFVVEKPAEASEIAERFRQYVESPVLTNVKLEIDGFDAYDLEPAKLPDLFGERPLVVMGKYRGQAHGTIRISGTNGQGSFERSLRVEEFRPSDEVAEMRYLPAAIEDASIAQGQLAVVRRIAERGWTTRRPLLLM